MTNNDFKNFVLDELRILDGEILCRPMMGEYLLYYNGQLFGGFYDNRLLVKIVEENKHFGMPEAIPYKGAKPMYMVTNFENADTLKQIVLATCNGLKKIKK